MSEQPMDSVRLKSSYLEFPVQVRPRLSDDLIHRVRLTNAALEITTLHDATGFITLLAIPHVRVLKARFTRKIFGDPVCRITYRDETDQQKTVQLAVLEPDLSAANVRQTWAFAQTLQQVRTGKPLPPANTFSPSFWHSDTAAWLLYGLLGLLYLLRFMGLSGLPLAGSLGLATLTLYHVHHRTAWHPAVKLTLAALLFLAAISSLIPIFAYLDTIR